MLIVSLASSVTSNGTQAAYAVDTTNGVAKPHRTYQATATASGALTATVKFYGSQDNTNFSPTPLGTITLSGSNSVTDNFASFAAWPYARCEISGITGSGTSVSAAVSL